ncbi:MAG: OmpA family protein [Alphaproteobacteria bacterium]
MNALTRALLVLAMIAMPSVAAWAEEPAADIALPFDLFKFEPAKLYAKKADSFAKLDLGGDNKPTGKLLTLVYSVAGEHTPLEIVENYKENLTGQGFSVSKDNDRFLPGSFCGNELPNTCPEVGNDLQSPFHLLDMKKTDESGDTYVRLVAAQTRKDFKGHPLLSGKKLPDMILAAGDNIILIRILTPKKLENKMVKENINYILDQLKAKGKVDLYGVYFDVDKTDIKPESQDVMKSIVKVLQQDAALRLQIGGHTDNTGSPDHNLALSQGRAEAVVNALKAGRHSCRAPDRQGLRLIAARRQQRYRRRPCQESPGRTRQAILSQLGHLKPFPQQGRRYFPAAQAAANARIVR